MKELIWKKEYSVGVELFDRQHQHLFGIINKITDQQGPPPNLDLVDETLNEMFDYAGEHFTAEEELMEQYDYPEIETHKKQHYYFIKTMTEIAEYPPEKKSESLYEIVEFLNIWWITHILRYDMKYKEFFKEKIAPAAR